MSLVQDFIMEELSLYGDAQALYTQPWHTPGFPLDSLDLLQLIHDVEDAFVSAPLTNKDIEPIHSFAALATYIEAAHEQ